ncbi:MAG: hypothetical protein EOP53_12615 [Sphingobacteriales bacterium]|nr:MAG: hypothetical protein EOP53_12615 [Sphingobacteriales bacterium]
MICSAEAQTFSYFTPAKKFATNRNAFFSVSIDSFAKDTTKTGKKVNWNSPGMVALQSALIPGLGQISNGKLHILKVPVIYAGFAVCGYFIYDNHKEYKSFRDAYRLRTDGDSTTIDIYDPKNPAANYERGIYTNEQTLLSAREFYRKNRDLTIIITSLVYAANILDAYVFAHLKDFDVSDDLSLAIKPVTFSNIAGRNHITTGIQLKFK